MKQVHYESFRSSLLVFFKNNHDAVNLAMMLIEVADVWDDVVDGDSPTEERVNKAFRMALIDINDNPFYAAFQRDLRPIILSTILKWLDANKLEKNKEHLEKAYMLRAGLYDLFAHIAYIIGGHDWYDQVGVSIRKLYGENFADYKVEICQIQYQE